MIEFTQPVYNASESSNAVVRLSVTVGKIDTPITVKYVEPV